jgi:hypothetical protein
MIDLHERLSEFSYGYGVTREVEALLASVGLHITPFLPSLVHEASLGFDVAFNSPGTVVMLQFKLGDELRRFHRTSPTQSIPALDHPFWRFSVDASAPQFQRLAAFEQAKAQVYYVAPRFSSWAAYDSAFQKGEVLEHSLLLKPSEITRGMGGGAGVHRIVYDRSRRYVCSEPIAIEEETSDSLLENVARGARDPHHPLAERIATLLEREAANEVGGRLSNARRRELRERAKRPIDADAAIVGLEAWTQGTQVLFVTSSPEGET